MGLGDRSDRGEDKGPRWGKEESRNGEMQEVVGNEESGQEDWKSWVEEFKQVGEEVGSGDGEGRGVRDEVGREVVGWVQHEEGRSSLEVSTGRSSLKVGNGRSFLEVGNGRSSLASSKSCQGRPELASCYMAWLSLECDNGQDHTLLMEKLSFTLVREGGEVLEGRLGASCKERCKQNLWNLFLLQTLHFIYNLV